MHKATSIKNVPLYFIYLFIEFFFLLVFFWHANGKICPQKVMQCWSRQFQSCQLNFKVTKNLQNINFYLKLEKSVKQKCATIFNVNIIGQVTQYIYTNRNGCKSSNLWFPKIIRRNFQNYVLHRSNLNLDLLIKDSNVYPKVWASRKFPCAVEWYESQRLTFIWLFCAILIMWISTETGNKILSKISFDEYNLNRKSLSKCCAFCVLFEFEWRVWFEAAEHQIESILWYNKHFAQHKNHWP